MGWQYLTNCSFLELRAWVMFQQSGQFINNEVYKEEDITKLRVEY